MVLVYAGRRAQSLPTGSEAVVAQRARRLLAGLGPSAVVGSAANGADLLVLEAALEGRRTRPYLGVPKAADLRALCMSEEGLEPLTHG